MSDTDSSISSFDGEGDAIMRPIPARICKYKVTLKVSFVYTYEREYYGEEGGDEHASFFRCSLLCVQRERGRGARGEHKHALK